MLSESQNQNKHIFITHSLSLLIFLLLFFDLHIILHSFSRVQAQIRVSINSSAAFWVTYISTHSLECTSEHTGKLSQNAPELCIRIVLNSKFRLCFFSPHFIQQDSSTPFNTQNRFNCNSFACFNEFRHQTKVCSEQYIIYTERVCICNRLCRYLYATVAIVYQ